MAGADDFLVAGYETCRACGEWAVEGTLVRGHCSDCAGRLAGEVVAREVAYEVAGRTVVSRPTRARKRRKEKRNPEQKRAWNRARSRALHRLARVHRPLYEVIFAQEKAAEGLAPELDVRAPGSSAIEKQLTG